MIYILVLIFHLGAGTSGSPSRSLSLQIEFNNYDACASGGKKIIEQMNRGANVFECLPKGAKK